MDRRRLEEAYLQYALLKVSGWYSAHLSIEMLHLHDGLSETLLQATPSFHKAFLQKYSGKPQVIFRVIGYSPQVWLVSIP
jgi:hypothetical protein